MPHDEDQQALMAIERPHRNLFVYYVLSSLSAGPLFFLLLIPRWFRYHTMRYRFDEQGIVMRWGILFRREITLTYSRIQDIHLVSNLVERWLGLARIQIQTASGSAAAEMTLEGIPEFEALRDFLYTRMRGSGDHRVQAAATPEGLPGVAAPPADEMTAVLRQICAEVRAIRQAGEQRGEHGT